MLLSVFSGKVTGPFKVAANLTVIPMQKGISRIGEWMGDMSDNFQTLKQVQKENETLQAQVDELLIENNNLQEDKYELERLQELYKLDQNYAEYEKVAAHVIGKDSGNWFSTFTIDKGSKDGIEVDMNVIAGNGLVGIVKRRSVRHGRPYARSSTIRVMSAEWYCPTSDKCIIRGDLSLINSGRIRFEQMENNDNVVENRRKADS